MARKILLFLSAVDRDPTEAVYLCPDGGEVSGGQTNEAPVKYLLRRYPDVTKILCVVTDKARQTALERFRAAVRQAGSAAECKEISFEEGENFEEKALPSILSHVQEDDEILLETTGGFRNAVMYLLLISRALSYAGVRTVDAVYSNFGKKEIEDVSRLIGMFDLVGGMQEMTSFGSADTLRAYYAGHAHAPEIDGLLDTIDKLWESITLCRAGRIEADMEAFQTALERAEQCDDPLMRALLPAFRNKFGRNLTIPGLIRWCVRSGLLQQAVTVYTERVPAYLVGAGRFLRLVHREKVPAGFAYKDPDAWQFTRLARKLAKPGRRGSVRDAAKDNGYDLVCRGDRLEKLCQDYLYIQQLRNRINHASDGSTQEKEEILAYLADAHYKLPEEAGTADIKSVLLQALERMKP